MNDLEVKKTRCLLDAFRVRTIARATTTNRSPNKINYYNSFIFASLYRFNRHRRLLRI